MKPVKRILSTLTKAALLVGLAANFNACSEQSPMSSKGDNTTNKKELKILHLGNQNKSQPLNKIVSDSELVTVQDGGELFLQAGAFANQAFIQPVGIAYFSSELSSYGRNAINTINNTGMSDDPSTAASTHNVGRENMWITSGATTGVIAFDLGDNYNLTETFIWNYNETSEGKTARGIKDVEIYVSADSAYSTANFTSIGDIMVNEGGSFAQTFSTIASNVRLVKIQINSNHGYPSYVGLSEVRFGGSPVSAGSAVIVNFQVLPGAVVEDVDISINTDDELLMGDVYLTFGPHGTVFNPPAILDIDAFGLDLSEIDPEAVNVFYDNAETGQWELMQSTDIIINQAQGYIKVMGALLPHFSRYAIGAE